MSLTRLWLTALTTAVAHMRCAAAQGSIPGDFNADGVVNESDWLAFGACLTGPAHGPVSGACAAFDFEPDGDVDLADFARLTQAWLSMDCTATATASTIEANDPQYAPTMAVDGNFLSRWSSAFADNQWLMVDYGRTRSFSSVRIHWETAYARTYRLSVSADAEHWTQIHYTTVGDGGLDEVSFPLLSARYLLVECITRATQWGSSIWEIRLISDDNCYQSDSAGDEQIEQLIQQMTLEEKTSFVYGASAMEMHAIPRLGIPGLKLSDGPVGIRDGQATAFPAAIAMSATWDLDLMEQVGAAIGLENRNKGRQVWLGPCVNIVRVPQGGRDFETCGEDPYLNARMATAAIRGAQSQNVVACVKHFACNNQEYDRMNINIQVGERALHEIYMPAFRAAVQDAGAWAVMSAYNRVNGPFCTESSDLQTDILKSEWGFRGFVVSDWGAAHSTVGTANAGLDLEMDGFNPTGAYWGNGQLLAAVQAGTVSQPVLDDKVRRILRAVQFTGVMEEPWPAPNIELVQHRALVRDVGRSGIVLLKNVGGRLPLDPNAAQTIAVLGPNCYVARVGGGGSSEVTPYYSVTPVQGLQNLAGPNVSFVVEPGVVLGDTAPAANSTYLQPPGGGGPGLRGEYFANMNLQGTPVLTRVDPTVDFDWGLGSPGAGVPADGFSVRWTGTLQVPVTGNYNIGMTTDDGTRLYLDGLLLINDWTDHAARLNQQTRALVAGHAYNLVIEYYEHTGSAVATLSCFNPDAAFSNAVAAAASADVALIFAGLSKTYESEGYDRPTMDLGADQVNLINSVAAVNPNTIVVMVSCSQVGMDTWIDNIPTLVQAWYLGQEEGNAIADVLFGVVNPSGKLPETFIRQWADHPCYTNYPGGVYTEGLYVGYRHFDKYGVEPLFPFGHGLSYTTFAYSGLNIDTSAVPVDGTVTVSLQVQNTGPRIGAEVVQLYVRDVASSVDRPVKELKGFAKVSLAPGEQKVVAMKLDPAAFSFYDVAGGAWVVEPGVFETHVGSSSRDIRLIGSLNYP